MFTTLWRVLIFDGANVEGRGAGRECGGVVTGGGGVRRRWMGAIHSICMKNADICPILEKKNYEVDGSKLYGCFHVIYIINTTL